MRFLGLDLNAPVPDATTIWLFREALVEADKIGALFALCKQYLEAKGFIARGGQIIDATIVEAPRQRNTREENETIKSGETPAAWQAEPAKLAQKDVDARWTKKHGKSFYGYKNHVGIDRQNKLIRRWDVKTNASIVRGALKSCFSRCRKSIMYQYIEGIEGERRCLLYQRVLRKNLGQ